MGKDGFGPGVEERLQPLGPALSLAAKPADPRLHGRLRGHQLRPRQQWLLDHYLPRLRFPPDAAADAGGAFAVRPERLAIEIGFGGGEHAIATAAADPALGLIACEVFEPGLCSLLSALAPEGLPEPEPPANLRVWDEDARVLLRGLPDACLSAAWLMFPDPWPKLRHTKRRFVHPEQVRLMARVMKVQAIWRVASDDPTYQQWVEDVMAVQDLFDAPPPASARPPGWPPTRYEAKALKAGRTPRYWTFTRTAQSLL